MSLVRIITFFISILAGFSSFSMEYFCPKTPINIVVGQTISDDWFIWVHGESIDKATTLYYKKNITKYKFEHWFSMVTGVRHNKRPKNYIGCCGWLEKYNKKVCAYKYIKENDCESNIRELPRMKFVCPDKNKR